jgi:hypothetical protein
LGMQNIERSLLMLEQWWYVGSRWRKSHGHEFS